MINISKFENIEVSIRTDFFNFTAKNIFVKIKNLFRKIRHIDESYGSLLPKLMSVELEY